MSTKEQSGENRVERIRYYESIYQQVQDALHELEKAMKAVEDLQPKMAELEKYYTGPLWRQDFEADEAGEIPQDLKRGILSEDGIYNLIEDNKRWQNCTSAEI